MDKKNRMYTLNIVLCSLLIAMIVVLIKTSNISHGGVNEVKAADHHMPSAKHVNRYSNDVLENLSQEEDKYAKISHENIVAIMDQFMDTLVQDTDDNYKVIAFDDIRALLVAFETIATKEVSEHYVDFYYEEKDDGLYIVPTETPPWFMADNPYDVVQLNNETVQITQTNETDFYGTYTIEFELTYHNGWKITDITHL